MVNFFTAWLGTLGQLPAARKSIEFKNYPGVPDHICRSDLGSTRCDRCFGPLAAAPRNVVINEAAHGQE